MVATGRVCCEAWLGSSDLLNARHANTETSCLPNPVSCNGALMGGRTLVDLAEGPAAEDGAQLGEAILRRIDAAVAQLLCHVEQVVQVVAARATAAAAARIGA
jgi:hypothetical protein